jgi:mannosyltransferase
VCRRQAVIVAGITLCGALLRFPTLDTQSFWSDEALTVRLMGEGLGGMLSTIPDQEITPPFYFLVAWGWTHLFGSGEVGLRSLSALLGTALIPVAYAAASRLGGFRAGCIAAALTAANPLLVWYSQEARSYALFALLGGLSLLFFLRAREVPDRRWLVGWAVSSGLALATHYLAVFLVAPELMWLLVLAERRQVGRIETWLGASAVAAVGVALLPLALYQRSLGSTDWIAAGVAGELPRRVANVPAEFLTGYHPPGQRPLAVVAAILSILAAGLLLRPGAERARRAATVPLALAVLVVVLALALAVSGLDFLLTRNLIVAWLPLAIVVALGAATPGQGRLGIALAGTLCALGVAMVVAVASDVRYQRDDWRGAARAIASLPGGPRAVLVTPADGDGPLSLYLPGTRHLHALSVVSEVDLLSVARRAPGKPLRPPRPPTPPPPAPGFATLSRVQAETFTLVRYRASPPAPVSARMLAGQTLTGSRGSALLVP